MKVLDLFSGIGGFSLGLERAGMETVAFCEIDPYCRKVLNKHWPDVPCHEDIRGLNRESVGHVDLVCGGFPCQPFSTAGKRRGAEDDRHLWPEMLRVIREVQPAWVIAENVIGFESMGLQQCVSDLESHGFAVQVLDIPACGVGAIHRRHRLWILANRNCGGVREQSGRCGGESRQGEIFTELYGEKTVAADTGSYRFRKRRECLAETWSNGTLGNIGWPLEPAVGRVANGIPNRVDRLRALGNAVVPQIPEMIGRAIMSLEQ